MTGAQIIDITGRPSRHLFAHLSAAAARWEGIARERHAEVMRLLDQHENDASPSAELRAAHAAMSEATERANLLAAQATDMAAALVETFEQEILTEAVKLTTKHVEVEGSLEAGCLVIAAHLRKTLRAEVTGDPSLADRIIESLKQTDGRWKVFAREYETKGAQHG